MVQTAISFLMCVIGIAFATAILLAVYEDLRSKAERNGKLIIVLSLVAGILMTFLSGAYKRELWETVELPEGVSINDALKIELFAPYSRNVLLDDPEEYGEALRDGIVSSSRVQWKEYIGENGRIRVCHNFPFEDEEEQFWLQINLFGLYVDEAIDLKYLKDLLLKVEPWKGVRWKLTLIDKSRVVTFELDGEAVDKITDMTLSR